MNFSQYVIAILITGISLLSPDPPIKADREGQTAINQKIPVLCYHQVRDWKPTDSKSARTYIIPTATFKEHMKILSDSGYSVILPEELTDYLQGDICIRYKPIVLTFDDGTASQYDNALPALNEYGFKATFFIMTVTLDKPFFMRTAQVKSLARQGHAIGFHGWDHHPVNTYLNQDWDTQLLQPTKKLQQITGKSIKYFAYPYGIWNQTAIEQLKSQRYWAAFQLAGKGDINEPLFTINRIIADGHWNGRRLIQEIEKALK